MANLQRKPALHLSVAPGTASPTPSTSQAGSFARRVGSWGSATSETYHTLSAYGDQRMAPLPSPLEGREWGFFGGDAAARNGGGSDAGGAPGGGNWQSGWNAGSVGTGGRSRASSVFEEFRDPAPLDFGRSVGRASVPGASARTDSWVSSASNHHGAGAVDEFGAFPSTSPAKSGSSFGAANADADVDGRREPARSKTLSFFDDEMSRALSPPLNPPSRNNSLNHRSTNGPRPPASSSSTAAATVPPSPGWEQTTHDPLRSSIASSSGGSWLDEAAGGSTSWMRGRGGSIGSVASTDAGGWQAPSGALTPRRVSPSRPLGAFLDGDEASPLHELRPRLAALNTASPTPSAGFASPTPHSLPHKPLSSLPSAVEPGPRSRFLDLGSLGSRTNSPSPSAFLNNFVALDDAPSPASSGATTPAGLPASRRPARDLDVAAAAAVASTPPMSSPREDEVAPLQRGDRVGDYVVERVLGTGSFSRVVLGRLAKGKSRERGSSSRGVATPTGVGPSAEPGLVALKLLLRKTCEENERMRISVMREVEVLKNIQHPSLVSLSSSFSTPVYTALVLDYCPGGELFDFLADWHQQVSEGLARRMFGELCSAVGWMHEVGLVHRDIKLENILLTCRPFPCASPSTLLSSLPTPFVKLTDFGLSRFINPASPLLATRCGSEEYAAPELIMGKRYDGRHTDAWALGVVLFAIITGVMPFVEATDAGPRGRKAYLLKIAKADYRWPGSLSLSRAPSLSASTPARPSHFAHGASASEPGQPPSSTFDDPLSAAPLPPSARLVTPAVQVLVGRLLVRDPAKRATVRDVWDSEWMDGEGRPPRVRGTVRGVEAAQGPAEMPEWSRRGSEFLDD